ncbi:hypothetical protein [Paraburkholderia sp. GAS348]|uniref:hypothetical protein n=1 Tax=Paraburkholderia sp. GAS348 TaxID=3035132 RepID=UPI003D1AC7A2
MNVPDALKGDGGAAPQNKSARASNRAKRCGAVIGDNKRCKNPPALGHRRCKRHGGSDNGAPIANQNARTHGFFTRDLSPEDIADLKAIAADGLGDVDHEVMAAKLRVRRVERAEQAAKVNSHDGLELQKRHDREASEYGPGDEAVYERVDYGAHSDRAIKTALHAVQVRESLIERRAERDGGDDDGGITRTDTFIAPDEPGPENPIL